VCGIRASRRLSLCRVARRCGCDRQQGSGVRSIAIIIGDLSALCAQAPGRVPCCLILALKTGLAMLALALPLASARAESTCALSASRASILMEVSGFKSQTGVVNVWVYRSKPDDFLVRDKRLSRLRYPVPTIGALRSCIVIPGPGRTLSPRTTTSNSIASVTSPMGWPIQWTPIFHECI
jgi:hypothetical protein